MRWPVGWRNPKVKVSDLAGLKAALAAVVDSFAVPDVTPPPPQPARARTVGYFTSWSAYATPSYGVRELDTIADQLTHVVYCFATIGSDLRVSLGDRWADVDMPYPANRSVDGVADAQTQQLKGHFHQLRKLKTRHPHLKVLVALGGPGQEGRFAQAVATPEGRQALAESVVEMFFHGNIPGLPPGEAAGIFDGLDLDWEFPQAADKDNLTAFIAGCRARMDEQGGELTAWVPANDHLMVHWDNEALGLFDFVVVQGYDLHGPWESNANYASALGTIYPDRTWFTCERAVDGWLAKGVAAENLLLGVPFYCHGWTGVEPGPRGDGLWQPGLGMANPPKYRDLHSLPGVMGRTVGMGASKYDAVGKKFYSVDDPTVMAEKAAWVVRRGLGGVAAWELSGDTPDAALLTALAAGLSVRGR